MMIILMFYFWVEDPTAYEHDNLFCILGVIQLLMIYMYIYVLCWAWTLKHMINETFCVEREALEHMSTYICVEHKDMEHMKI